jgi:Fic family protein
MDKKYKPIGKQGAEFVNEIIQKHSDVVEKLNDPVFLGMLVAELVQERENTNRILKNLMNKLENIEAAVNNEKKYEPELLPDVDLEIVSFVKHCKKVTASDVQKKFKYKGTNAASARLNKLCNINILTKKQVGRRVYFMLARTRRPEL